MKEIKKKKKIKLGSLLTNFCLYLFLILLLSIDLSSQEDVTRYKQEALGEQSKEQLFHPKTNQPLGLGEYSIIRDIKFVDDTFYILTKNNGLFKHSILSRELFSSHEDIISRVNKIEFLEYDKGFQSQLWMGDSKGSLLLANGKGQLVSKRKFFNVVGVIVKKKEIIYLTKNKGIFFFKRNNLEGVNDSFNIVDEFPEEPIKTTHLFKKNKNDKNSSSQKIEILSYCSSNHQVYIGTKKGLYEVLNDRIIKVGKSKRAVTAIKFNKNNNTLYYGGNNFLRKIQHNIGLRRGEDTEIPINFKINNLRDLHVDVYNNLWIASDSLLKYNLLSSTYKNFNEDYSDFFRSTTSCRISEDKKNNEIWVGTLGSGIFIFANSGTKKEKDKDYSPQNLEFEEHGGKKFLVLENEFNIPDTIFLDSQIVESKINFLKNEFELTNDAKKFLDDFAIKIKKITDLSNYEISIKITGHTSKGDEKSTEESQIELSKNRANAVKDYLVRKNLVSRKVEIEGIGKGSNFLIDAENPNSEHNRRVEIRIEVINLQ